MAKKEREIVFNDGTYRDSVGRNVIVDRLANVMYIVPKSGNKQYNVMRARNAFVLALGMACGAFISLPAAVIALVVGFAVTECFYRLVYLRKLQKIENEELPEKPTLLERYAVDNNGTLILMSILSLVMMVVLPLYIKQEVKNISLALKFVDLNSSIIVYGSLLLYALAIYIIYASIVIMVKRSRKQN